MSDTNNIKQQSSVTGFLKSKEFIIGVIVLLVVVIAVFYLVRKNREFSTKIDILAKKFEEQQQVLSKHEEIIGHLVGVSQQQHTILGQLVGQGGDEHRARAESDGIKIPEKPANAHRVRPAAANRAIPSNQPKQNLPAPPAGRPAPKISPRPQAGTGPIAETLNKNFAAGLLQCMSSVSSEPAISHRSVRFADPPAQHFGAPEDEDDIEEESEPELDEQDDLDAELAEELRELQEMREAEEDLNSSASNKKK